MTLFKNLHSYFLLLIGSGVFYLLLSFSDGPIKHPEKLINGTWEEVAWRYDKHDKMEGHSEEHRIVLNDELKESIAHGLHIRQSETWVFEKGSKLTLLKKDEQPIHLNWRMKGRGHILALNYNEQEKEFYQIQVLTHDKMVLYFNNDTHARGIIQIVFKRIK